MKNDFLILHGNTNDLLYISSDASTKMTRLIKLDPQSNELDEEVIDVVITSTNCYGNHPLFDKILDKKIKITVEILD